MRAFKEELYFSPSAGYRVANCRTSETFIKGPLKPHVRHAF